MKKTLLIDGNSLINRAFYALPILSTDEGVYTNAVYGFLRMFYKAVDEYQPDNIVCAFDVKHPTFRHEKYADYKAGRKKMPEELVPQIPLLKEVLKQLGVFTFEIKGFEADDIIGTYCRLCEEENSLAAVLTGDRDSFQLISPYVSVWFTKKGISEIVTLTPENLKEYYGVEPWQVCDLKALMGDSSDNIPGIQGVGEKTAITLIQKYSSIENMYEHEDEILGKMGQKIRDGKEDAFQSKFLATIVKDVPVTPLNETKYAPPSEEECAAVFKKYQFKSLYERVGGKEEVFSPSVQDFDKFNFSGDTLAFYIDENQIIVSKDEKEEYRINLTVDLLSSGMDIGDAVEILKPYMQDKNIKKVFYDVKSAYHLFGEINNVQGDILLAEYLLDANGDNSDINKITAKYSCVKGAAALIYIHKKQLVALEKKQLTSLYYDMELPLAKVLYSMELAGFYVDSSVLRQLGNEFTLRINELTKDIYFLAGKEFNINSPVQLSQVLFEDLGLPAQKKTKRGFSTDNDVLESLEHPIIEPIIEYRQLQKLKSTYVDGMFALVSPKDNRIHSTFKQAITATGRISSTEPNLQNIPVRYEQGRQIRRAFLAKDEDHVLVNADYSQIELRILAHLSGDETLINSFKNNEDIHARTAAEVFSVDIEQVTSSQRSQAKAVNFGIVYGISDFGLAKNIGTSRKEAAEFMEMYFSRYKNVEKYLKESISEAKKHGYAKTIMGRRREIPELRSQNYNVRSFGERVAMNAPIQGSAADIIKLAMLKVHKALEEKSYLGKLILQVHDELIIETPKEHLEECRALLKEIMENVCELCVPLTVETNAGRTWFSLK
ncbi:MAG: DNA polymerase I [Clostridiales bacterium]|nr:DNA polymerase I [Clostridiales bacterium]